MSQLEEEEMEIQHQAEEIEEVDANEEVNEKENEEIINNTIVESLINRSKKLEEENSQLKEDIQKISSYKKGGALEYFTNFRKNIFNEIESLNKQIKDFNKSKIIEAKKTKKELDYINGQLNNATELNQNLKSQLEQINNEIEANDNLLKKEENVELKNLPNNDRLEELDYKINSLTAEIAKNDFLIKDQKDTIDELNETYETQAKSLNEELENIKNKYHNLLGAAEITEDYFDKDFNEKTKEFKKNMESNIYHLTKKLLNSNNDLSKKNQQKENFKENCETKIEQKNQEIVELKSKIKHIQTNYDLLYKLSIDQLTKFGDNFAKFKSNFFNREKDCINLSNYYKDTMAQYNKSLLDEENPNNILEKEYHQKASTVISLQQENDKLALEAESLKQNKFKESNEIRKEISNNINNNDKKISEISNKEKDLATKIKKFKNIYNEITQRNGNIDKLSKENKHILNENKMTENKIFNYFNNMGGENDINNIKLNIKKLEEEAAYKNEILNNYEEMFKEDSSEMGEQDEVRDDVIKRLKEQIEGLKNQIEKLNETRENMDNYYTNQISELKGQLIGLIKENNNLRDTNQLIENDFISKNQRSVDSWQKVFKDMKSHFGTVNDIQNLITSFEGTNKNLLGSKEFAEEKELKKLRDEAYEKEKLINDLNEIKNREENKYRKNIKEMTESISTKVGTFNELNNKKNLILGEMDKNVDELVKINESKLNYSNNELEGIEEHKNKLYELINNMKGPKLEEIKSLKVHIKNLEAQIKKENEKHLEEIKDIKTNCDEQLKIIKDREDYIMKQTNITSNNLKSLANQNERAVEALRQENQQLKNQNYTLSKRLS